MESRPSAVFHNGFGADRLRVLLKSVLLIFLLLLVSPLYPKTLKIKSGDSLELKKSIENSTDGDTILVEPGTYYGTYVINNKSIVVKSKEGPEKTILDGQKEGSVVTIKNCPDTTTVLQGFTLKNGSGTYINDFYPY
jgi:nitrous oxidase accessory protein NosD